MARNIENTMRYTNEQPPLSRDEMRKIHTEKKKRKKKRKRILTYIFLLLSIVGVGVALSLTVFFKVNEIQIKGNSFERYTDEDIAASSGISVGDNLFLLNSSEIKRSIERLNPYIGSAQIIKKPPYKVVISITETKPAFAIANGKSYILISDQAKMLETVAQKPEGIALLKGINIGSGNMGTQIVLDNEQTLNIVKELISVCEQSGLKGITSLDVSNTSDIYAVYDGRIAIHIGAPTNLSKKLPLAREIIAKEEKNTPGQYGEINLTVLNKGFFKKTQEPPKE